MSQKYIRIDSVGVKFPIGDKTILINGKDFPLPDLVWDLLLQLEAERDYYQKEFEELMGYGKRNWKKRGE